MPSFISFSSEKYEMVNGERRWSRGKMNFDPEKHRWDCDGVTGEDIGGQPKSSHHKSSGTYSLSDDRRKLRLQVQQHDGDNSTEESNLHGRELEFNLDDLRDHNYVPSIFSRQRLEGDVRRLE